MTISQPGHTPSTFIRHHVSTACYSVHWPSAIPYDSSAQSQQGNEMTLKHPLQHPQSTGGKAYYRTLKEHIIMPDGTAACGVSGEGARGRALADFTPLPSPEKNEYSRECENCRNAIRKQSWGQPYDAIMKKAEAEADEAAIEAWEEWRASQLAPRLEN
jgi:hypothetical protein